MSKQNKIARLTSGPSPRKKPTGRTADVDESATVHTEDNNYKGNIRLEKMIDVNRAEGNRASEAERTGGDRRDTNKTYTGNARHAARGNTPRVDVSTRKR